MTSNQIYFYATSNAVQRSTANRAHLDIESYQYPRYMTATLVAPGTTTLKQTTSSTVALKRNAATEVLLTGYGKTPAAAISVANIYAIELEAQVQRATTARAQAAAEAAAAKAAASSNGTAQFGLISRGARPSGLVLQQPAQVAIHSGTKTSLGSSRKVRLVAGLVLGALLGAAIVLLRELLNKRIRSSARPSPPTASLSWWRSRAAREGVDGVRHDDPGRCGP